MDEVTEILDELIEASEVVEEAEAGGDVEEIVEGHLAVIEAAEELIEIHLGEVGELLGEGEASAILANLEEVLGRIRALKGAG